MALRNTIQRKLVLDAVNRLQCHATADQIFKEVRTEHTSISRATVYRNLNVLAKEGKIRRLAVANGADCFDHITTPHYHVRCTQCGRVMDIGLQEPADIDQHIANANGFELTGHDLLFHGICPACHNAKTSLERQS